jgi:hypothetical protein
MHKNKNKITKIVGVLVVVAILTSGMPFSVFGVKASSCYTQEWYSISSNGETYTINVVTETPLSNLDQKPLSQTDPIETVCIVDSTGNLLTDVSLAKNLIIDAQSKCTITSKIFDFNPQ